MKLVRAWSIPCAKTDPAFAISISRSEQTALVEKFLRTGVPLGKLPQWMREIALRSPGVFYAFSGDGIELPIVDVRLQMTHQLGKIRSLPYRVMNDLGS